MARTSRFRIELLMPAAIRRLRTAASSLAGVLLAACIGSSNPFGYDKDSDRVVRWADRVGVKEIPPEGEAVSHLVG